MTTASGRSSPFDNVSTQYPTDWTEAPISEDDSTLGSLSDRASTFEPPARLPKQPHPKRISLPAFIVLTAQRQISQQRLREASSEPVSPSRSNFLYEIPQHISTFVSKHQQTLLQAACLLFRVTLIVLTALTFTAPLFSLGTLVKCVLAAELLRAWRREGVLQETPV